jgi:hypothetical protein
LDRMMAHSDSPWMGDSGSGVFFPIKRLVNESQERQTVRNRLFLQFCKVFLDSLRYAMWSL